MMGNLTAFGAGEEGIYCLVNLTLLLFCFQEKVMPFCLKGWTDSGSCPTDLHLNIFL